MKAFYNPKTTGDTSSIGLTYGMEKDIADRTHSGLGSFLEAAGRNHNIVKVPAVVLDPFGGLDDQGEIAPGYRNVENQYHLMNSLNGAVVSPKTVTDQYAPMSLGMIAEEVRPWLEAGWASPDAVYEAKDGALEILSLRLDADQDIEGETFSHYIVIQNPHGGGKVTGKLVSYRFVCQNMCSALGRTADIRISHRAPKADAEAQASRMQQRARTAVSTWDQVQDNIRLMSERINAWQSTALSHSDALNLTERLLGIENVKPEDISRQKSNARDQIVSGFNMPQYGTNGASAWDWYNAVTFAQSSPNAGIVKTSKVSGIERSVRNMAGTGYALESAAVRLIGSL